MQIHATINLANGSSRIYDTDSLDKALKEYADRVNSGMPSIGGVVHAESDFNTPISLSNVTHSVKSVSVGDGTVDLDVNILDTPMGLAVQDVVKNGTKLRFCPTMEVVEVPVLDEDGNETGQYTTELERLIRFDVDATL